ncbi:methyltransferase domain-containing protein [Tepidiphilus sp. J10]|uniref:methyltransferase domain-containing protein n=1 Tax=Tepidiphilus sp. J10 TaxID=2502185 RepID=UPI00115E7064|nr:methyltransferase domain-containing protein [Tepidiphilus sp. J10]
MPDTSTPLGPDLDSALIRRRAERTAPAYPQHRFLAEETAQRLLERLDYLRITPRRVLDLGGGNDLPALRARYPQAEAIAVDFAPARLAHLAPRPSWLSRLVRREPTKGIVADAHALPLATGSVDFLWSNLLLHWLAEPLAALAEWQRVLAVGGTVFFATVGPDTLRELREVLGPTAVHPFLDMHDVGDLLMAAGFADPVMDMQMLTLRYRDPARLWQDLRASGATNARRDRRRTLTGKVQWQRALAALEMRREADGTIPITVELVFGHAWKAAPKTLPDGRAVIRVHRRP